MYESARKKNIDGKKIKIIRLTMYIAMDFYFLRNDSCEKKLRAIKNKTKIFFRANRKFGISKNYTIVIAVFIQKKKIIKWAYLLRIFKQLMIVFFFLIKNVLRCNYRAYLIIITHIWVENKLWNKYTGSKKLHRTDWVSLINDLWHRRTANPIHSNGSTSG